MRLTNLFIGLITALCIAAVAAAGPVDSNIAVSTFAQTRGTPCSSRGGTGCGGCYPAPIPAGDITSELSKVNPEWQPISPMIDLGGGTPADASLPPFSAPVVIHGTVALTKINTGGDFPASHVGDDQNTFITLDSADANRIATGNNSPGVSCPGEGCDQVEMEWEFNKYPLFAWAGEGDRITAVGRWIFDCGHPDPEPGTCAGADTTSCTSDLDCADSESCEAGFCALKCISNIDCPKSNACTSDTDCAAGTETCSKGVCTALCQGGVGACTGTGARCITDADCSVGNTCTNPTPLFNYRAELHPPQAVAVFRQNKFLPGGIPATRADVYVSPDGGGAGDQCVVTHIPTDLDVLTKKSCFSLFQPLASANVPDFNHCSLTARHCALDSDCPGGETCVLMKNFEFDMPLPPQPNPSSVLKTSTKKFSKKGGVAPVASISAVTPGPTPFVHVVVPMPTPLSNGKMPNFYASSITAGWKDDTTALKHVTVKFVGLTVNNPVKDRVPAFPRQCTSITGKGLSGLSCTKNSDCASPSKCISGFNPGWTLFGQVNGDWVQFKKVDKIGASAPFSAPPYSDPSTPLTIKQSQKFEEWVPSDGAIHIATTGMSLNCLDYLYGTDAKNSLNKYGLSAGAGCLAAADHNLGPVDVTLNGPTFMPTPPPPSVAPAVVCTPAAGKIPANCFATSGNGEGGHCSVTDTKLCASDADCPGTCSGGTSAGPCVSNSDCKHCSITTSTFCATDVDCPAGTCSGSSRRCRSSQDCAVGKVCNTSALETCVADTGATCSLQEQCEGTCSNNSSTSCHIDDDCGAGNKCEFSGTFTLNYTIQVH